MVEANKQEIENVLRQSELIKKKMDQILNEITSVEFMANLKFSLDSFGILSSKLDSNLTRFENENENEVEETLLPANISTRNPDSMCVSSTTNIEPILNQFGETSSNFFQPDENVDIVQNEIIIDNYNSGENSSVTMQSIEDINDLNFTYEQNFEIFSNRNNLFCFARSNSKYNGGFIVLNFQTFEIVKEGNFDCKSWSIKVFQNDTIFIGTTGMHLCL